MWDDFYIGTKPDGQFCSATALWYMSDLSQNSEEYWWGGKYVSGRIRNSSKEGKKITKMVSEGKSQKIIELYVETVAMKTLTPVKIMKLIQMVKDDAFEDGREDKAREIRKALGMR